MAEIPHICIVIRGNYVFIQCFYFSEAKAKGQKWSNTQHRYEERNRNRLKTVHPVSNFVTALGLGQPSCKIEPCHAKQGRSVLKKNKPNLPQRRQEALRNSWQPREEEGGGQQQEVPEACGTHAGLPDCGGDLYLCKVELTEGGCKTARYHQQMARQKDPPTLRSAGPGLYPELRVRWWTACEDLGSGTALGGVLVPNSSTGESRQESN